MKTNEIESILKLIISPTKANFLGVFPKDLIPSFDSLKFPACLVSNTDPSSKPGTHWVALYLVSPTHIEFFDSYGLHPRANGFTFNVSEYNRVQFQSISSNVCGQYCIYYFYKGCNCLCPIHNEFIKNSSWNDNQVAKWVKKISTSITPHSISCCTTRCIQSCTCRKQ